MVKMMPNSIARQKSMDFAVRVVKLHQYLCDTKEEYILAKQILRSGTSIGANLSEAECAISPADFLSKIYISYKECSETLYWIELLNKTKYLTDKESRSLKKDCKEIIRILAATIKTIKNKCIKRTR